MRCAFGDRVGHRHRTGGEVLFDLEPPGFLGRRDGFDFFPQFLDAGATGRSGVTGELNLGGGQWGQGLARNHEIVRIESGFGSGHMATAIDKEVVDAAVPAGRQVAGQ